MNMAIARHVELASVQHPASQFHEEAPRGFISYTVNAYSPKDGLNRQIASVIVGGLAMELLGVLRPEFPNAEFTITRQAREMSEFNVEEGRSNRVKDLVIWLRESDEPGHDFLTLTGYRGNAQRLAWYESAAMEGHS